MLPLFRPEALQAQNKTGLGEVLIIQPRLFRLLTGFFIVITASAGALATFGEYSRKETVRGYLAPVSGIAPLYATRGGIITSIAVADGDLVEEGDILIRLDTDTAGLDAVPILAGQRVNLQSRLDEIERQIDARSKLTESELQRLRDRISSLNDEIDQLSIRRSLADESVALARTQMDRWQLLGDQGLAPALEVERARQAYIAAQASRSDILRSGNDARARQQDAEHELNQLPDETELALSRLRAERASLHQALSELDRASGYTITAPVSGRVTGLQTSLGATARPDVPLVTIMPEDENLTAHLLLPTRFAGLVEVGQDVSVKIDAFPYQRYGALDGVLVSAPSSAMAPYELAGPISVEEPVFRLSVELLTQSMSAYGSERALQAGMTLTADIIVDKRPLWRVFMDPVLALRS